MRAERLRRWTGWGLTGLAAIAAVVLLVQTVRKALRPYGYDLTAYVDAGADALAGASPYGMDVTFPYLYPPFFACLMTPWSFLPPTVAAVLWFALSIGALVVVGRIALRWVPAAAAPPSPLRMVVVCALLAAATFRLVHSNLVNGQVNLILAAMCVLAVDAARRDRPRAAGCWLALAVHTKALPILLVAHLALRRRWGAVGWCAAFGALFAAVPALFWGSDVIAVHLDYLEQIDVKVAEGTIDDGALTIASRGDIEYFTLRGLVATLVPAWSASVVVKYACIAVVVGAALLVDAWLARGRAGVRAAASISALLAAALMISPISEKHHLALLLPALAVGAVHALRRPDDRLAPAALLAGGVCITVAKPWPEGPWYLLTIVAALALVLRVVAVTPRRPDG